MDLISFPELEAVLRDFAKDFQQAYKDELERNGRRASGDLINSVHTEVVVGDTYYAVDMTLRDYWKYIENGTAPHWPPLDAIQRWIEVKPIIPRPFDDGRIPSPKQLAFLIGRKISKVGTEGSHDLEKTKDVLIPYYRERIAHALGNDMAAYLRRVTEF